MRDILLLERVQCRATKFILNSYTMNYKTCKIDPSLFIYYYLFINALQVCRTPGPTACSKTLATEGVLEKLEKGEKIHEWT